MQRGNRLHTLVKVNGNRLVHLRLRPRGIGQVQRHQAERITHHGARRIIGQDARRSLKYGRPGRVFNIGFNRDEAALARLAHQGSEQDEQVLIIRPAPFCAAKRGDKPAKGFARNAQRIADQHGADGRAANQRQLKRQGVHRRASSGQHEAAENENENENEADQLRQTDTFQGHTGPPCTEGS